MTISGIVLSTGLILILIGIWGMLTHRDILRIIIGFVLMGTGSHLVIIAIGYVSNGTAPIIDEGLSLADAPTPRGRSHSLGAGGDGDRYRPRGDCSHARLCDQALPSEEDALDRRLHGIEMVGSLLHPLNIFILGLGGGFLIPLLNRLGKPWVIAAFISALGAMTVISAVCLVHLFYGAEPIEILTGGSTPPYSINLRMGLAEAFAALSVNLIGLLGAFYFVREKYAVMLLYLVIVMGIQGMVMTRDLFNLFVFLEIVSVATYGLLSLGSTIAALSASFKFLTGDDRRLDLLSARHHAALRGDRHAEHRRSDR